MHHRSRWRPFRALQSDDGQSPHVVERRLSPRKPFVLKGVVSHSAGVHNLNCGIGELSEGGARIVLYDDRSFPSNIYLINLSSRLVYEAEVVWNNGSAAGVKFLETLRLNDITDPGLAYLKDLWHERATPELADA